MHERGMEESLAFGRIGQRGDLSRIIPLTIRARPSPTTVSERSRRDVHTMSDGPRSDSQRCRKPPAAAWGAYAFASLANVSPDSSPTYGVSANAFAERSSR